MITSTLITLSLAEYAARDDFRQIGKGSKIRHGLQWLFRASVVALACYLDNCLPYAVPLAFLFSAVFRWRLNGFRELDWRCVGPWSSVYDCLWMTVSVHVGARRIESIRRMWPNEAILSAFRSAYVTNSSLMVKTVHRAGTLAYIFEAVVFVVGTVWYICSAQ